MRGRKQQSYRKIGFSKIPQVDLCPWKESEWEDTDEKDVRSCNRCEEGVYTKEREDVSVIKGRERKDVQFYKRTIEKRIYQIHLK